MSDYLEHSGYTGTVEYSATDNVLHGEVLGIRGLITYEGTCLESLKADFMEVVDGYISLCEEKGVEPQKPYSGILNNVKISPSIHRHLALFSDQNHKTINETIEEAIKNYVAV